MSHNSIIIDTDSRFSIDAVTREIKNLSTTVKNKVIQYDHNSERIGFSMPRYIEGHDMTKCNRVEIHYKNIDTSTKEETAGVYEVKDVEIDTTDDEQITFSWLVSQNATQRVGLLCFLVRFACVSEDGTIGYAWNTGKFSGICVSEGMYNADEIVEQYADVLEQWKQELQTPESAKEIFIVECTSIVNIGETPQIGASATYTEIEKAIEDGNIVIAQYDGANCFHVIDGIDVHVFTGVARNKSYTLLCYEDNTWGCETYYLSEEKTASESYVDNAINNATPGIVDAVIEALPNGDEVFY